MTTKDTWFKLFVIVLSVLISVVSAASGYLYSNLSDGVVAIESKFETHREAQFQNELITAERLKAIEVNQENQTKVLEQILEELRR